MLLLFSVSGSYLQLLNTVNRPWYTARMYTDYSNTGGRCIGFAYAFLSEYDAMLRVLAIQEDKSEILVTTKRIPAKYPHVYYGFWLYLMAELPDGINMIMIEGQRGPTQSDGLALDDIEIKPCPLFKGKVTFQSELN